MADRALGDMQLARCAAQAAQAGNGLEGTQGGQGRRVRGQIGGWILVGQIRHEVEFISTQD
ncbi:hypothetical protein D3C73_881610 [compost metagenome]